MKNKDVIINFEIFPADHLIKKSILNQVKAADWLLQKNQQLQHQSILG